MPQQLSTQTGGQSLVRLVVLLVLGAAVAFPYSGRGTQGGGDRTSAAPPSAVTPSAPTGGTRARADDDAARECRRSAPTA